MNDNILVVNNLTKYFYVNHDMEISLKWHIANIFKKAKKKNEKITVFENISFSLKQGESIGLCGKNGSGKSTLLKIIADIMEPSSGSVKVNGKMIPLISMGAGFSNELTGIENLYINASLFGKTNKQIDELYGDIVSFAGIENFMDTKLKYYSSGMRARLSFAIAIHMQPDILLADEVLAVGDKEFKDKCQKKVKELRKNGMALVFVSHDEKSVENFCDRSISL
jgi:ABC-2 type transport system ATP-binding protein/lipopolysaccharide transport system ATP-binding protein